jgi:hypothetical protein
MHPMKYESDRPRVLGKTGRSREEMASLVDSALKLLD